MANENEGFLSLKEFLKFSKLALNSQLEFMHLLIDPWLEKNKEKAKSPNQKSQKDKEIKDLGRFISMYNRSISIVDALCERPDAIIRCEGEFIGVELSDVVIEQNEREKEGLLKKIHATVEELLLKQNPNWKGNYMIRYFPNIKLNTNKIINEVVCHIIGNKIDFRFVERVDCMSDTYDLIIQSPHAFFVGEMPFEAVNNCIVKKEEQIKEYDHEIRMSKHWLLLVCGGMNKSSSYSELSKNIIETEFKSSFDKIFFLDYMMGKVIELNTKEIF